MTNYEKLVEALNRLWQVQDDDLEDWVYGSQQAMHDAAAAIEELQDKVFELEEELNDADIAADDNGRQIKEMAKRNAELHAELEKWVSAAEKAGEPKRGEWIHVEGDEPWEWRCTACHKIAEGLGEFRFCPNCGAKMEVQDGQ